LDRRDRWGERDRRAIELKPVGINELNTGICHDNRQQTESIQWEDLHCQGRQRNHIGWLIDAQRPPATDGRNS
jgi:hypothetical protein